MSREGALGAGYYFGDVEKATYYSKETALGEPLKNGKVRIYDVQLDNPLILDAREAPDTSYGPLLDPTAQAFAKLGMDPDKAAEKAEYINEEFGYPFFLAMFII